jgi:hypothetical protein
MYGEAVCFTRSPHYLPCESYWYLSLLVLVFAVVLLLLAVQAGWVQLPQPQLPRRVPRATESSKAT